ncbi:MAG: hypothetical protein ACREJD_04370 [Phycisphaerales bacterium]
MRRIFVQIARIAVAALAPFASAQSLSIDPAHKFSWCENAGFLNWADAGAPLSPLGARFFTSTPGGFFKGFAWGENIGWINLGPGAGPYANTSGATFGVNADSAGKLSGMAWSENGGWINFNGGALATPAQPARIDFVSSRLRGYAWSENFGWLNLDHATIYVGLSAGCPADLNVDGFVDDADFVAFLPTYNLVDCAAPAAPFGSPADLNGDGFVDDADFQVFVAGYNALVCP